MPTKHPIRAERCPKTGLVLLMDHRPKSPMLIELLEPEDLLILLLDLKAAQATAQVAQLTASAGILKATPHG